MSQCTIYFSNTLKIRLNTVILLVLFIVINFYLVFKNKINKNLNNLLQIVDLGCRKETDKRVKDTCNEDAEEMYQE